MPEDYPFLQLTVDEAKEVVRELEDALETHRRWLKRLQRMLVCRLQPDARDLREDSHLQGEFGRWYYRRANPYLRQHPAFETVGRHHERMHDLSRELAALVADDQPIPPTRYDEFSNAVDAFKKSLRAMFVQPREMLRYTDPLTGVANRYAMLPRLEQERERIKRTGERGSVCVFDLDRFKRVNDTYGHHAGDIVLQETAGFLQHHLRQYDQLYRYGGEEFLLLLPETPPDQAAQVVDRLRAGLAETPITLDDNPALTVTASFGVAELDPEQPAQTSIDHADEAMYQAKQNGRNRVEVWGGR